MKARALALLAGESVTTNVCSDASAALKRVPALRTLGPQR